MGSLTDDMTRLCGEIVALRGLRQAFVQDLVRTVAQLKAGFRQAHEQMSRETREGRAKAVLDLKMSGAGRKDAPGRPGSEKAPRLSQGGQATQPGLPAAPGRRNSGRFPGHGSPGATEPAPVGWLVPFLIPTAPDKKVLKETGQFAVVRDGQGPYQARDGGCGRLGLRPPARGKRMPGKTKVKGGG